MAEETGKGGDSVFTPGETTILIAIMQHLMSDISFDADAVAEKLGYKDGSIVKTRWNQIKRKKINSGEGASPAGIKKRTPAKKGAKAAVPSGDDAEDDEEAAADTPTKTPAKRGRKPKAKKEEPKKDEEGEGDGNDDVGSDGERNVKVKAEEEDMPF